MRAVVAPVVALALPRPVVQAAPRVRVPRPRPLEVVEPDAIVVRGVRQVYAFVALGDVVAVDEVGIRLALGGSARAMGRACASQPDLTARSSSRKA